MSTTSPKTARILACVLCQNRKIKCDRNTPCSNCIKANVSCTPSTPAPARKRRRPNQDLQQRLAKCEELLSAYATAKPESSTTTTNSPDREETWRPLGKLIVDDGGVKLVNSHLWVTIHDELSAMREILDDEEGVDDSTTPAEPQSLDVNTSLVLSDGTESKVEDLHPPPAQVFRLWQTFLERVNPLTKVIHVPTVQPYLVEAATNRTNIPKNVEALLFSIYLTGVAAMSESECVDQLGYSREAGCSRFSKGCRLALIRIGILKSYNMVVLQALVLYLFSMTGQYDRHGAWILNGVAVRIAQKMGLHRDGDLLGLPPFETEMRRRVWWQIVMLDAVYALTSGMGQSLLPRSWDTKEPHNLNDADLYPSMTTIQPRDGPTDMIYCLTSYEIAKAVVNTPFFESVILQNEMGAADSPSPVDVERARKSIDELDDAIGDILNKYGDLSMSPIHELAVVTHPMMIEKIRVLLCPAREQPEWGTEILTAKDNLFKIAITSGESSVGMYQATRVRGYFLWFMKAHFQIELLIYMVGQLSTRVSGQLVDRAWAVLEQFYHFHDELFDLLQKPHLGLAIFTLKGWKMREQYLRTTSGQSPESPSFISKLRSLLPSDGAKDTPSDPPSLQSLGVTTNSSVPSGFDLPWDNMFGFVDTATFDWDGLSSVNPGTHGHATSSFGNLGMGFETGTNGWM